MDVSAMEAIVCCGRRSGMTKGRRPDDLKKRLEQKVNAWVLTLFQLLIIGSGIVLESGFIVWVLAEVLVCVQRERGLFHVSA